MIDMVAVNNKMRMGWSYGMESGGQGSKILRKTWENSELLLDILRYLLSINFTWAIPGKFDGISYYIRYYGI